jgi:hypothetical protein
VFSSTSGLMGLTSNDSGDDSLDEPEVGLKGGPMNNKV